MSEPTTMHASMLSSPDAETVAVVMLLREDTRTEAFFGIIGIYRNRRLRDDRTMIGFFIDKMHRDAGDFHAVL